MTRTLRSQSLRALPAAMAVLGLVLLPTLHRDASAHATAASAGLETPGVAAVAIDAAATKACSLCVTSGQARKLLARSSTSTPSARRAGSPLPSGVVSIAPPAASRTPAAPRAPPSR